MDKSILLRLYSQEKCPWLTFKRNMDESQNSFNFRRPDILYTPPVIEPLFLRCYAVTIMYTSWTFSDRGLFVKKRHLNPCYLKTSVFICVCLPNLLYVMLTARFWNFARNVTDVSQFSSRCPQNLLLSKNDNAERSISQIYDYLQQ